MSNPRQGQPRPRRRRLRPRVGADQSWMGTPRGYMARWLMPVQVTTLFQARSTPWHPVTKVAAARGNL